MTRQDVKNMINNHISKARKDGQEAVNEFKNRQNRETLKLDAFNPQKTSAEGQTLSKLSSLQDKINASLRPYKDI